MNKQNTSDNIGSLYDLEHSIILHNGKRICVCNGHFCDLDGLSEYDYLKGKRETNVK